jgi:hypothetical protein
MFGGKGGARVPIDQALLNNLTTAAGEFLSRSLPRHFDGVRVAERDGHCEVALGNPHRPDHPMRISTAGGEVTVEFGECHTHFDSAHAAWGEAELVGEMIVKVVTLAGGAEASYSAWAGGRCFGGGWLPAGSDGGKEFGYFPEADRLKVVAWEPWNDREVHRREPVGPPAGGIEPAEPPAAPDAGRVQLARE